MEGSREYFEKAGYPGSDRNRYVPNRRVACEPLDSLALKPVVKSGFAKAAQKVELYRLKVVFGNERYQPGSYVFVRGEVITLPWAREAYSLGERSFILVPEDAIQLVELEVPGEGMVSHGC
jgi:hypothetical protein